jgi:hypothetical protein
MAQRCIDVYNKMPEKVRKSLDVYKTIYSVAKEHEQYLTAKEIRFRASAYCKALMDAGLITDRERSMLFILTTT